MIYNLSAMNCLMTSQLVPIMTLLLLTIVLHSSYKDRHQCRRFPPRHLHLFRHRRRRH